MTWSWGKRGSDGLVFGPLPQDGFLFDVSYHAISGIKNVKIGSWDTVENTMQYVAPCHDSGNPPPPYTV